MQTVVSPERAHMHVMHVIFHAISATLDGLSRP